MLASEPAHYRLCLLESKRISEGAQEKPCLLERTAQAFAGARRSLGEEKDRHSSGGAAYMQLFKGERLGKI